jgi:hypothetical protein
MPFYQRDRFSPNVQRWLESGAWGLTGVVVSGVVGFVFLLGLKFTNRIPVFLSLLARGFC